MRIAVIGSGVSGLVCAHLLGEHHDVVVHERDERAGGHAHTQHIALDDADLDVDTGFLVYNEANYPGLVALFSALGVRTKPTEMSFSLTDEVSGLCWRGSSLDTVFAQRRNAARPEFLRLLGEIVLFNRAAKRLLVDDVGDEPSLAELVARHRWSSRLTEWYLVPLGAAVWSADPAAFLDMPARTFARFFDNHGLLRLGAGKGWRTVDGGSARYVEAIAGRLGGRLRLGSPVEGVTRGEAGVEVSGPAGTETFDHVILATHSDQALRLLRDPSQAEQEILGAIRYRPNDAVLHTDERLLPPLPKAWAAWNYHRPGPGALPTAPTVTYLLNRLQGLPTRRQVCVTLNRSDEIDPDRVLARMDYAHPVFDAPAVAAQARHAEISGPDAGRRTSYCGAYWGHGFHEDGLQSAARVCASLGVTRVPG